MGRFKKKNLFSACEKKKDVGCQNVTMAKCGKLFFLTLTFELELSLRHAGRRIRLRALQAITSDFVRRNCVDCRYDDSEAFSGD